MMMVMLRRGKNSVAVLAIRIRVLCHCKASTRNNLPGSSKTQMPRLCQTSLLAYGYRYGVLRHTTD
jgi:hypothetical protein